VQNATLSVGGKRIRSDNAVQQFTWNAQSAASAQLTASYLDAKDLPLLQFQGTWSTSPAIPSHTTYICRARS
jgi:type VI protein secretion system component VasK